MNTTIKILIGVAIVVAVGFFVVWQKQAATMQTPADTTSGEASQSVPTTDGGDTTHASGITAAEVAKHTDAQSCWSIINGNVYDLTSWIPQHPGGPDKILQLCGVDGSVKFNGKHGGNALQAKILAGFKIGVAAK